MAIAQYFGTGRRKTSVARVRLVPGDGKIIINNKDVDDYFNRLGHQKQVREPLETVDMASRFDVIVKVEGGGTTGQAGAVSLGIARALLKTDESLRPVLKREDLLTRDPRMKEREKYGLRKARKAPQWSKR
ncbi:MAG: 30S ribosomal protein S9 [Clostridia bacterium]|nr:30S ribosomal protein S9 [Clostridia bacterium]